MIDKRAQGKRNKANGRLFELKVRRDLEKNGFFVSKWVNQVEDGKLIPAKHKFNFFTKVMSMGTGFPDFIAFKREKCLECDYPCGYLVIGVEAKSTGYLDKAEKEKIKWLLDNEVFDFILTAYKGDKRGEILYEQELKGGIKQKWK